MKRKLILIAALVLSQRVWAAENPKFIATCSDVATHIAIALQPTFQALP